MRRRLLASYLTLTIVVLVVLEVPLGLRFEDHERDQLTTQIERDAVVLGTFVEDALQEGGSVDARSITRYTSESGARVVVVDEEGRALIDTDAPSPGERSFATRPEIIDALDGRVAIGTRHSDTLDRDLLYVAVPVASAGRVYGAVRVTYPTTELDRRVDRYWWTLGGVAAVSLLTATLVGLALARSVTRPLGRLERAASAIGHGDLTARAGTEGGPPVVRSLAGAFDDMASRLKELVDAQDAFVADASHQLRNPLTGLRLRLENLAPDVGPEGADDLRGALDEAARLSRIVDGLLALARVERDGARRPEEAVDVSSLIEERRQAWVALAEERGVTLDAELPSQPERALVTPDRFTQVLDNLLANALDVSAPGSTIILRTDVDLGCVEVHVVDQGPGLDAAERARAFDRFWRASSTPGSLGGSGIGLSIVHKLVQADGGDVELVSAPGGGLDAVVRLRRG